MRRSAFCAVCLLISLPAAKLAAEDRAKPLHGPGNNPQATISTQNDPAEALESRCSIGPQRGPLLEVMNQLAEDGKIRIVVDAEDFKRAGIADVNTQLVILPTLVRVRLKRALQMTLDQIGGTYLVSDGDIIVGTTETLVPKKKMQLQVEFDKAERALRNQIEELRDRRRLELAQLPQPTLSSQASANAELDKKLEEIEHRLGAIEKRLEEFTGRPHQSK